MQSTTSGSGHSLLSAIRQWWRDRSASRATVAELSMFEPKELHDIARDAGATTAELQALAGKWPGSADLLTRRMSALGLDASGIARSQPSVSNDLNKLCSLCGSKRRCRDDLARDPKNPAWQEYCPNSSTLIGLCDEQTDRSHKSEER